ncbi:lysozyme [Sphingobacterium suaedae]|uniref:Lysozyme n=1 Tax=Sphingobacterium suaedae TaxID=1686402 RepID=A0ABW5KFS2_9SPHI
MKTGNKGLSLIKSFEGFYSKPYLDPVGIPTIGYGVIKYPNGKKVTIKDAPITEETASDLLAQLLEQAYEKEVSRLVKVPLNQNQFDALVSFTYNLGSSNLSKSTLLKKVNKNPCDPTIANEFSKWVNAGGKKLAGLVRRRKAESDLYFSKEK